MNILFITIAWPASGERNLYSDLMDEFATAGHKVYVVGANDTDGLQYSGIVNERGISVLRIRSGKIRKTSHIRKMVSLLGLERKMMNAIDKHFGQIKIDLILSPTPPITLAHLYIKLKKKYRANFYLLLKDIWPQGSVDHQVFRKYSIPWLFFRLNEIRTYKTADYIGCMSPLGVRYILSRNKYLTRNKVEVCPNCIRPNEKKIHVNIDSVRSNYNIPPHACVFIFSGNLGVGHGLGFLIEAIRTLKDYSKAFFIIGGSGTHFRFLSEIVKEHSLKNVFIYQWLPAVEFEKILAASDVGLILLYKYTVPQFPSRLLSYLDYSKPVLCAVNKETDIGTIVTNSGSGCSVIHGDLEGFIYEVKSLSENKYYREEMGRNARKLLIHNYTVKHAYEIIMSHFNDEK